MHYADKESKNIYLKNHIEMIKEHDFFKKERNRSIPIFSGAGSEWGEKLRTAVFLHLCRTT